MKVHLSAYKRILFCNECDQVIFCYEYYSNSKYNRIGWQVGTLDNYSLAYRCPEHKANVEIKSAWGYTYKQWNPTYNYWH